METIVIDTVNNIHVVHIEYAVTESLIIQLQAFLVVTLMPGRESRPCN